MKEEIISRVLKIASSADSASGVSLQKELTQYITVEDHFQKSKLIAGIDLSYSHDECFCAIIVLNTRTMEIAEKSFSKQAVHFPYIPGLLFYREFPAFYEAYKKLKIIPDILIFDGQGLSHQRMMGIATMSGIILDIPTIGCAKSHLFSDGYQIPEDKKFATSDLKINGKLIGYVLRTKENIKPIFISSGHLISPQSALDIIKGLITKYKLPLPTHLAHNACENFKLISAANRPALSSSGHLLKTS